MARHRRISAHDSSPSKGLGSRGQKEDRTNLQPLATLVPMFNQLQIEFFLRVRNEVIDLVFRHD
jgi:hypothetical protein